MISIVIPALDEEKALPATLDAVRAQSGDHELIVADGGSCDRTCAIAERAGARIVRSPPGRGRQMNAGARCARGEWLLFLHADTLLPGGALEVVSGLPATVEAGCFHQAFNHSHLLLSVISHLHNWRCRATRIMYGDQAMFVRRRVFDELGGFPETHLEDVRLSERLRERAEPALLPAAVVTDARKFIAHGIIRSVARIVLILVCHRLGLPLAGRRFLEPVR